jgi:predicted NAD/FAD-dependent oxidoreductase
MRIKEAPPQIAVIGAGISGLTCATALAGRAYPVAVFEKARGPGGRMSTRRVPDLGVGADFDHGAQYFTVRSPELSSHVQRWSTEGVVAPWHARFIAIGPDGIDESSRQTQRVVGTPGMNAICRRLAASLDTRFGVQISAIEKNRERWTVLDDAGDTVGTYEVVLCTAPAPQTEKLLRGVAPAIAARAATVRMQPCWSVLVAFADPVRVDFDGAFVNSGPLSWVARTSAKPARESSPDRWVLHAGPSWSAEHLEDDADRVIEALLPAFLDAIGAPSSKPAWSKGHRWRYALAENPLEDGCLYDASLGIGACGDWANGNRVEGAFLSGLHLAQKVEQAFHR